MTQLNDPFHSPDFKFLKTWGFWAVSTGALGLILVFAQIVGPMSTPQPSAGTQIGEIAGDISRAAWRSFFGMEPEEAAPVDPPIWLYVGFAGSILGVMAIVLSLISAILREHWHYPAYGLGFGVAAVVFQFVWWLAVIFMAMALLVAIVENIGDIFGGVFGG